MSPLRPSLPTLVPAATSLAPSGQVIPRTLLRRPRPALARPTLTTDLTAVAANMRTIRARTVAAVMAVVKADAFGHGMHEVARTALASGATWIGVTDVADGLSLRTPCRGTGVEAPILSWLHPAGIDVEGAVRGRIDVAVGSPDELDEVLRGVSGGLPSGPPVRVHLHVDTGMARGGATRRDWPALFRTAAEGAACGLIHIGGLMGHLPDAHLADPERNLAGSRMLAEAETAAAGEGLAVPLTHLGATAAALTDPTTHRDLVRIGAGLVGIDPSGTVPLRPASRLSAPIVHTARVPAMTPVGYGGAHRTAEATNLAVIGLGYADGIPRELSTDAAVSIEGVRFRIVGRVSMDQIVVDTGARSFPRGTLVTLWGPPGSSGPSVQEWARWAGSIPHAIVTGVSTRVRREAA